MMQSGTPKTAIDYIHALGRFTGRPGLHRIRALCAALGNASQEDCILVCGSLFLVGEAEKILRTRQKTAE